MLCFRVFAPGAARAALGGVHTAGTHMVASRGPTIHAQRFRVFVAGPAVMCCLGCTGLKLLSQRAVWGAPGGSPHPASAAWPRAGAPQTALCECMPVH